jgi:hypothetical protein
MSSRQAEYKKRRLIKLHQRIQELEAENKEWKAKYWEVYHKNVDLESENYYLKTHPRR